MLEFLHSDKLYCSTRGKGGRGWVRHGLEAVYMPTPRILVFVNVYLAKPGSPRDSTSPTQSLSILKDLLHPGTSLPNINTSLPRVYLLVFTGNSTSHLDKEKKHIVMSLAQRMKNTSPFQSEGLRGLQVLAAAAAAATTPSDDTKLDGHTSLLHGQEDNRRRTRSQDKPGLALRKRHFPADSPSGGSGRSDTSVPLHSPKRKRNTTGLRPPRRVTRRRTTNSASTASASTGGNGSDAAPKDVMGPPLCTLRPTARSLSPSPQPCLPPAKVRRVTRASQANTSNYSADCSSAGNSPVRARSDTRACVYSRWTISKGNPVRIKLTNWPPKNEH